MGLMSDIFSKAKRSEVMSRIRSHGNKNTEIVLAKFFRRNKITGWRRNQKIFGKPDFIFPTLKLAVFVDGCFWHSCSRHGRKPKGNAEFWQRKLSRNKTRDRLVTRTLRTRGWRVLRIWEHELVRKNETHLIKRINGYTRCYYPHPTIKALVAV